MHCIDVHSRDIMGVLDYRAYLGLGMFLFLNVASYSYLLNYFPLLLDKNDPSNAISVSS